MQDISPAGDFVLDFLSKGWTKQKNFAAPISKILFMYKSCTKQGTGWDVIDRLHAQDPKC